MGAHAHGSNSSGVPLTVSLRAVYFSRDGAPADAGGVFEIQVNTHMTVEAFLSRAREAVGCGKKGRLLYRGRPLSDPMLSLEQVGIARDPEAVHLMISRKYRPQAVADKAKEIAAELEIAMAQAAAEAAARPPRRPPPNTMCAEYVSRPGSSCSVLSG